MKRFCYVSLLALLLLMQANAARAQHPIDVQRDAASGDYMGALVTYEKMPQRIATTQSRIAAAKSAWALSLPDRALAEYEGAIRQGGLDSVDLARVYLGRGIIQHQEGKQELAILEAQKALEHLKEPSPLRAQVLSLWGESLSQMKVYAPAAEKYTAALAEASTDNIPEIAFLLGSTQFELGKYDDARVNLEKIPLDHDRAPEAVRLLARVAVEQGHFDEASSWLAKGRHQYPDAFLDSWTDYVMVRGAIQKNDREQEASIRAEATKRYAPSDPWFALLNAAAEEFEWKQGGK